MYEFDWWMTVENERRLLFWMSCGMIISGLAVFVVVLIMPAPYGRYSSASWGGLIDSRYAWFLQELPSLLVPVVLWLNSATATMLPNKLLLGAFIVHYVHRYNYHSGLFLLEVINGVLVVLSSSVYFVARHRSLAPCMLGINQKI